MFVRIPLICLCIDEKKSDHRNRYNCGFGSVPRAGRPARSDFPKIARERKKRALSERRRVRSRAGPGGKANKT
ncbi:unnamed protein product, partial [Iphiclides podalirius]